jgi:hypothetical protein
LPLVDPGALGEPVPMPSATLATRIEERIRAERRADGRRRRRVAVRVAAAAAVAAVLVIIGAVALRDDQRTVDRRLVAVGPAAISADARLVERSWGTSVTINANGLSPGITYGAWLERADGSRVPAGTFRAETDRVVVTLAAALPLDEGRAVGVSTLDGTDVLRAPLG